MKAVFVVPLLVLFSQVAAAQGGYVLQTIGNPAQTSVDFGTSIAVVGDIDGDARDDYVVGDPAAVTASGQPIGEVRLVSGATGTTIRSHLGTNLGFAQLGSVVAGVGDLDLDGIPDYGAGRPTFGGNSYSGNSVWLTAPGRVDVWSGATGALLFSVSGGSFFPGGPNPYAAYGDNLGAAVCGPGDVTGDGVPDLVMGAPGASSQSGIHYGKFLICSGATGAITSVNGTVAGAYFGAAVCGPGDLNGDGIADVVAGAPAAGNGFIRAYAVGGGAILWTANGPPSQSGFGGVLASAGDVDGDGVNDVVAGAPVTIAGPTGTPSSGQAFVLSGASGLQLLAMTGTGPGEKFGSAVSKAGDLNGDGYGDVLVSSTNGPAWPNTGQVKLVFGPAGAMTQVVASASLPFDQLGTGLAGGAFLNGDAVPDILVGVPEYQGPGRVMALSGATLANLYSLSGTTPGFPPGHFTTAVDAGDQDGDGNADLALGLWSTSGPIALVSGSTSQVIRFLPGPLPGTSSADPGLPVVRLGDVDGDGYQDFAVAAAIGPNAAGVDSVQMDAVSGATGALLHTTTWSTCGLFEVRMVGPTDLNGDGIRDLVVALPVSPNGGCPPTTVGGTLEVRSGATGTLLASTFSPVVGDAFGFSLDSIGDVDGDGVADLAVGAPFAAPGVGSGVVYVYSGATLLPLFGAAGTAAQQGLGASIAGIGDVSGDGIPDFAAADTQASGWSNVPVHIFSGAGGTPLAILNAPPLVFGFGKQIAGVGDVDGDGAPDIAVGAPFASTSPSAAGDLVVFSGASGLLLFSVRGPWFGNAIAAVGDRNQDGLADVFVAEGQSITHAQIVSFAGVPMGSQVIGSGCTLASGRTPALAAFGGDPTSGTGNPAFGLIVSNGTAGSLGALAAGTSSMSWNGAALPLALAPALPGCSLYVSVDALVSFALGGAGSIGFSLPVPIAPALAGTTVHFQAYVADSPAAPLPGAVTRGLTIVVQ